MPAFLSKQVGTDNESLKRIADVATKPWYKKAEGWFAFFAAVLSGAGLIIALWVKS